MDMYEIILIQPDQLYPLIGRNIRRIRRQRNMTQEQLAEKINGDQKLISKIETGKARPGSSIYLQIANVFHVSIDYFLMDTLENYPFGSSELPMLPMGRNESVLTQDILSAVMMYLREKEN